MPCCISTSLIVFKWEHREMRPRSSQDACRAIMTPLSSALASWGSTHTAADAACAAVLQITRYRRYSSDVPQISPLAPDWRSASFSVHVCVSEHNPPLLHTKPKHVYNYQWLHKVPCPCTAHIHLAYGGYIYPENLFFSDAENKTHQAWNSFRLRLSNEWKWFNVRLNQILIDLNW